MKKPFILDMEVKYSVATRNALWLNSVIGLEHRPYESSFSKAVLSSSAIHRYPFSVSLLLSAHKYPLKDRPRSLQFVAKNN